MLITDREDYKKDLEEVISLFTVVGSVDIKHRQKTSGDVFSDEFLFNGKTYSFKETKKCDGVIELKRYEKRFSKLALYKILSEFYKVNQEWGALTGIRPVKMARTAGDDFEKELKGVFGVSDKKIALVKEILETQKGLYDENGKFSDLFLSIPFCPSRCSYCSFISEEIKKSEFVKEYVNALVKETEAVKDLNADIRSVYIGGGTPTALDEDDLEKVINAVKPFIKKGTEFTVEAGRPDAMTEKKLGILKDGGVTRVCVNPQSFSDKTLALIGRKHSAKSVENAFFLAKSYGFLINSDIIAGLTGETFSDFKNTVDKTLSLNPDNFTVHTLCLKKGSKLKESTERLSVSEISKMIDYAYAEGEKRGYKPYYLYRQKYAAGNLENVGYSKKGAECLYNIDVMEENSDNIACGANAVSKKVFIKENRIERYGSPKDVRTYISKLSVIIKQKSELFKNEP